MHQLRFRIERLIRHAVLRLVEQIGVSVNDAAAVPLAADVAYDAKEPRTSVPADECVEIADSPQRRLLNSILGILLIAEERARQAMRGIQMRQHDVLEAVSHVPECGAHIRLPPYTTLVQRSYKTVVPAQ